MIKKSIILIGFSCLLLTYLPGFSQQQVAVYDNVSEKVKGFYLYTPQGYPETGVKYPLIIFSHGTGELGNPNASTLSLVLRNGIPRLINEGNFPTSFTVNGKTFKFIIISPQYVGTGSPSVNEVKNTILYAESKYPIDKDRIYLTGLSMGGGVTWYYPGYDPYFANMIAAIVPICGATDPTQQYANNIANSNLPVWATHNSGDPTVNVSVTNELIRKINERPVPPRPLAKKTIFNSTSHDAWTATYDPNFKENGMNIYEWMLQYKRGLSVLAVDGLTFSATATDNATKVTLQWSTTAESNTQGFKILKSADGRNFDEIGFSVSKSINGAGAQYSFADENPNSGKSFYKLEVIESNGASTFSAIEQVNISDVLKTTIFPNPAKNKLNIQTKSNFSNAQVYIYNTQGQKLIQTTLSGTGLLTINISKLKPGNYVAKIVNRTATENIKFIKQ